MELSSLISACHSGATWFILFLIMGFVMLLLHKQKASRETWIDAFHFFVGLFGIVFGIGYGFAVVRNIVGDSFHADYTVSSIVQLIFIIIWAVIVYMAFRKLTNPNDGAKGWRWLGILIAGYTIGAAVNVIFSGGRSLPFVGWFI